MQQVSALSAPLKILKEWPKQSRLVCMATTDNHMLELQSDALASKLQWFEDHQGAQQQELQQRVDALNAELRSVYTALLKGPFADAGNGTDAMLALLKDIDHKIQECFLLICIAVHPLYCIESNCDGDMRHKRIQMCLYRSASSHTCRAIVI
jgi:hypothetical protein